MSTGQTPEGADEGSPPSPVAGRVANARPAAGGAAREAGVEVAECEAGDVAYEARARHLLGAVERYKVAREVEGRPPTDAGSWLALLGALRDAPRK